VTPDDLARVSIDDRPDVRVVSLTGEIDASNADEVRDRVIGGLPNSALGIVADLSELSYLDSAGIALVFEVADRLGRRGQALALVLPAESLIRRALEVTQVDTLVPLEPTRDAAIARIRAADGEATA
jgi:anti-sigma B factor antagonist